MRLSILCFSTLLLLPGVCSYTLAADKHLPISTLEAEAKRFQLNQNPQTHYQMTITIKDAPGPFESINAFASYQAPNCTFQHGGIAAATSHPDKDIPIKFIKIADDKYQSDFYVDAIKDEDYYGQGVCKWVFEGVSVAFSAKNPKTDTWFDASVTPKDLVSNKREYNHLKNYYPTREKFSGYVSRGLNKEIFKPSEYFTMNIDVKKI